MNPPMENSSNDPLRQKKLSERPRAYDAEDLFAGAREILLVYCDQEYRLRLTKNRKLILTK